MAGAALLTGLVFVVEPIAGTESKAAKLKNIITGNGGVVSRIVTEETSYVLICDATQMDHTSPRLDKARQYNIPIIGAEYVEVCLRIGTIIPHDDFTVIVKTVMIEDYQKGLPQDQKKTTVADPSRIKVWNWSDANSPSFPTGESGTNNSYELVKSVLLQKTDGNEATTISDFCVLEIHTPCQDHVISNSSDSDSLPQQEDTEDVHMYRIFTHYGYLHDVRDTNSGQKECRFTKTGREAEDVYTYLYNKYTADGYTKTTVMLSRWIGSVVYRKKMLQSASNQMVLHVEVAYLVDYVWREAMGTLAAILSVPVRSVTLEKVEKAEAVLLEMRRAIDNEEDEGAIRSISERFFSLIPHKSKDSTQTLNKKFIARKQDICQLIKDIVNANESTGWSQSSDEVSKYRALNCAIDCLEAGHPERQEVEQLIVSTQDDDDPVTIRNIFAVSRGVEEAAYNHKVGNDRLMFHCSRPANFLGILSRGLLLPKIVVSELGVGRRDAGMLGSGLYFGDKFSTANLYSSQSEMTGTRLMVVTRVALGKIKEIFKHDLTLEEPPDGCDSTHGVCRGPEIQSDFTEDEYVVYVSDQQCIQYVVEFTLQDDAMGDFTRTVSVDEADYTSNPIIEKLITKIDVAEVQSAPNPVAMVQPGLVAREHEVELRAVHVRATIQDLAAQVVVFQSYKNHSTGTIEAKYVFPLDDQAAVCGFEAFINDKHVIGLVKDKELAKQEYKQAVAAGHGAYLMHEEAHNVFSVSVGNLPPQANVLIKITYVTELSTEGSTLAFSLLGSVAPWKRQEIQSKDTDDDKAYHIDASQGRDESLQLSLEMASDIRSIESPTHKIRTKHKGNCGSVILSGGAGLGDSFQLLIGLAEIHTPRLWVEQHPESSSQAAMLVFYPDFVTDVIKDPEIIVMLDLSNSMQGSNLEEARALTQVILKQLPAACTFNVVVFGSEYEELFPSSQIKRKTSLDKALDFIQTAKADRGSTEAWNPLRAYSLLQRNNTTQRNIFLVTDGHVTNEEATIAAICQNRQNCRVFTFGVSSTANHHALRAMSRLGGGTSENFDIKAKSTWEKKVTQQVTRSCQPAVTNIRVEWLDTQNGALIQAPALITTVFSGSRLVIYALIDTCEQVVLKADIPTKPYGFKEHTTVFASEDRKSTQGKVIHQLAARSIVRDWEEGALHADRIHHEARKNELQSDIVELSMKFSIVTPLTSFIAVEERTQGEDQSLSQDIGPSIGDLVAKEDITDNMPLVDWQETIPPTEVSPEKQVQSLLRTGNAASETFSFDAAERYYEEAYKVAEEKLSTDSSLTLEVAEVLSKFYCRVRRQAKKALSVIDKAHKKQRDVVQPVEETAEENLQHLDQLNKAAEWAELCKSLEESFEPADIGPTIAMDKRAPSPEDLARSLDAGICDQDDDEIVLADSVAMSRERDSPVLKYEKVLSDQPIEIIQKVWVISDPEVTIQTEVAKFEPIAYKLERMEEPIQVQAGARADSPVELAAGRAPSPDELVLDSARFEPIEYREESVRVLAKRADSPVELVARRAPSPDLVRLAPVIKTMSAAAPSPELVLERSVMIEPIEYAEERLEEPVRVMAARADSPVELVAYREPSPVQLIARRAPSPELVRVMAPVEPVSMCVAAPSPEYVVERSVMIEPIEYAEEGLDEPIPPQFKEPVECSAMMSIEPIEYTEERLEEPVRVMAARADSPVELVARRAPSPKMVLERSVRLEPIEYRQERLEEPVRVMAARADSPVELVAYREPSPVEHVAQRAPSPELVLERSVRLEPIEYREEIIEWKDSVVRELPSPELELKHGVISEPVEYKEEIKVTPPPSSGSAKSLPPPPSLPGVARAQSAPPAPRGSTRGPFTPPPSRGRARTSPRGRARPAISGVARVPFAPPPPPESARASSAPPPPPVFAGASPAPPPPPGLARAPSAPPPPGLARAPSAPPPPGMARAPSAPPPPPGAALPPISSDLAASPWPGEPTSPTSPYDRMPSIDGGLDSEEEEEEEEWIPTDKHIAKKTVVKMKKMKKKMRIVEIEPARTHPPMLHTSSIERLLSLQVQGSWKFSNSFDSILGIDSKVCIEVIGRILNQLESGAPEERHDSLQTLLATVLAVLHLRLYLSKLSDDDKKTTHSALCDRIHGSMDAAMAAVNRYPGEDESMPTKADVASNWWELANHLGQFLTVNELSNHMIAVWSSKKRLQES